MTDWIPPRGLVRAEPGAKRVRAYLAGRLVADSVRPLLVWEKPQYPAYYLPVEDVVARLVGTGRRVHSPSRGDAEVVDVVVDGRVAAAGALLYHDSPLPGLAGHVRLEWSAMDEWLEEDEPVYTHPRDPYTRVDVLQSSRTVRVVAGGVTVAESHAPRILFETRLPARYYLPMPDVRTDLLTPSPTLSHCPYKGTATYWSLVAGGREWPDVAWSYRAPLPESQKIAGMVCFYQEREGIDVDVEVARVA